MIVLDTNVVSEAMKQRPDPAVAAWLNDQAAQTLFLTCVTLAELLCGIGALPRGRRRNALATIAEGWLDLFTDRMLPFDVTAARAYAGLAVTARKAGQGSPAPDGCIAAIAAANGFSVATRDKGPFEAAGVRVIDP